MPFKNMFVPVVVQFCRICALLAHCLLRIMDIVNIRALLDVSLLLCRECLATGWWM